MKSVLSVITFNLMSLRNRIGGATVIVVSIAVVAGVLCGALAISTGYKQAFAATGRPNVAIVLSQGAASEFGSTLAQNDINVIGQAPGVAHDSSGALVAPDALTTLVAHYRDRSVSARVVLRGISLALRKVHPDVKLVQGRWFKPGVSEIVVGAAAAARFKHFAIGSKIAGDYKTWTVVGLFRAPGTAFASEAWTAAGDVQDATQSANYNAAYVKLTSAGAFPAFKRAVENNPQLTVKAEREQGYYTRQSSGLGDFVSKVGGFAALLMGIAAIFGAMSTLYTAIANRAREIATLRAIGFGRGAVLTGVLAESLFLALVGGIVGAAVAYGFLNGFSASTVAPSGQNLSNKTPQIAFAFAVTFGVMSVGVGWALIMGFIGGLFPAIRAARLPLATALRQT